MPIESISFFLNVGALLLLLFLFGMGTKLVRKMNALHENIEDTLNASQQTLRLELLSQLSENQIKNLQIVTNTLQQSMQDIRHQMNHSFKQHADSLTSHLRSLTEEIKAQLYQLSTQVNHRLTEGFEKTSSTFTDVVVRLAQIDEAQKKITELSGHVVSLSDILNDKQSRGAFGEVQLTALLSNMMSPNHYRLQHVLSNQKRADCLLMLPEPTGNMVVDAKFPLETYQKLMKTDTQSVERRTLMQQFRQDVQKHLRDIAEKYIIPNETADSALMFIPAEAIFSEIHANYPEIITLSQKLKVWLVSPSTLMAVLTTARAVLKDDATRKQVHIIQRHLQSLSEDFQRFDKRMEKLSKHIDLAHQDVSEVSTSAKKISSRFQKIESVDLMLEKEVHAMISDD